MDQKLLFRIQVMQLLQRMKQTNNQFTHFQPPGPMFDISSGTPSLNHNYNTSIPMYPSSIYHTPMYNHDNLPRTNITHTISPLSSNNSVTGYFSQFSPEQSDTSTSSIHVSNDGQAN